MRFTPRKRQPLPPLLPSLPTEPPGLTPAELAERVGLLPGHRSVSVALQRLHQRRILARSEPVRTGRRGPATYRYWIRSRKVLEAIGLLHQERLL